MALLGQARQASPALFWFGMALLAAALPTALVAAFDTRVFQGVSVWLKPLKFQLSVGIYALTLALFMAGLPAPARRRAPARYVVGITLLCGLAEVAYITWQGVHGLASHFNLSSPTTTQLYAAMGVAAVLLTSAAPVLAWLIWRSPGYAAGPLLKQSIVTGLVLTFVLGVASGTYMAGQSSGHWVGGVPTDAGGLPLLHWSRSGGDLRVPHFFGMHAMHVLPAFAWLIGRVAADERRARAVLRVVTLSFVVFCAWTWVQASAGRPFIG